jgi:hypothetical protein
VSSMRESPAAESNGDDVEVSGKQSAYGHVDLVALAVDVLRANGGTGPTQVELPSGGAAAVKLDPARRAAPALRALRGVLQDYVDGTPQVPATDWRATQGATALRDLLEIVLGKPLRLTDEDQHDKPAAPNGLDDAIAAAVVAAAAFQQTDTQAEPTDETWMVRNLTPEPLHLRDRRDAEWVVPAHGRRAIDHSPRIEFGLQSEEGRGEVEVTEAPTRSPVDYSPLALWFFLVPGALYAANEEGTPGWIGGAIAVALPLVWVLVMAARRREGLRGFFADLPALALQAMTFLIVLTFCVAVPAATLYYGADLQPVVSNVVDGNATREDYLTVVCRTMQLVLISVASLLPALLYYQFDRDRLSTLRERFEHQIFRLDRKMNTIRDIDAKYGRQIDEIYGRERSGRSSRLPPGRRAPILVATVLIMLGWLLVLLNPDVDVVENEAEIAELFEPRHTAPAFAFLGAYFFTLFALLRGYVRRDLRPKSYSDISVRIVTVVILAWVLELLFVDDSSRLLVFAFVVGIVPQALLNRLRELSQSWVSWLRRTFSDRGSTSAGANGSQRKPDDAVAAALADPLPLTDLQGIDLYDRTRLASEGVTNIEALAHHDLIELMLLTRIPVPRLVDWTDQAILHLYVDQEDRAALRRYGIRTASDLVHAYTSATEDDKAATTRDELLKILDADEGKPKRLGVIVEAMKDEAWMDNIRFWHGHAGQPEQGRRESDASRNRDRRANADGAE